MWKFNTVAMFANRNIQPLKMFYRTTVFSDVGTVSILTKFRTPSWNCPWVIAFKQKSWCRFARSLITLQYETVTGGCILFNVPYHTKFRIFYYMALASLPPDKEDTKVLCLGWRVLYCFWCSELGTWSVDWAQPCKLFVWGRRESSLWNVLLRRVLMLDNVLKFSISVSLIHTTAMVVWGTWAAP